MKTFLIIFFLSLFVLWVVFTMNDIIDSFDIDAFNKAKQRQSIKKKRNDKNKLASKN